MIETSLKKGSLSIFKGEHEIASWGGNDLISRSEDLLPAIQALLRENDLTPGSIDLVGVSSGPGSFTGLRVGISVGRGLALGLNRKIVGVSILKALALGAGRKVSDDRTILSIVSAGRDQVYWQAFGFSRKRSEALTDVGISSVPNLAAEVFKFERPKVVFEETLAGILGNGSSDFECYCLTGNMSRYIGLCALELTGSEHSSEAVPLYVREI